MACFALYARVLVFQKNFFKGHKKGCSILLFTILFFAFIALGALLFQWIEEGEDAKMQERLRQIKPRIIAKYNVSGDVIEDVYQSLHAEGIKNVPVENKTSFWTFGNSFLFAMSLVTTIGFGHLSPSTVPGKIFCMLYTSVGIFVNLMVMSLYVNLLTHISNLYKANLFRRLGYQHPFCTRSLHFFSVMVFIIVGVFFIPGWVFYYLEYDWSYLDAIYFIYISLTTVGLGDYVPALASTYLTDLYRFFSSTYLWVGTMVVMFMMQLITDFYQNCNKGYHIIPDRVIPEKKPLMPEDKPSYGAIVPIMPENKPPYEAIVNIMPEDQSSYGTFVPIMPENKPPYEAIVNILPEDQPPYETIVMMPEDQPSYGAFVPIMTENKSTYEGFVPIMPEYQPSYRAVIPIMPEDQLTYGGTVPEDQLLCGGMVPEDQLLCGGMVPEDQLSYGGMVPEDKPSYVAIVIPETIEETRLLLS